MAQNLQRKLTVTLTPIHAPDRISRQSGVACVGRALGFLALDYHIGTSGWEAGVEEGARVMGTAVMCSACPCLELRSRPRVEYSTCFTAFTGSAEAQKLMATEDEDSTMRIPVTSCFRYGWCVWGCRAEPWKVRVEGKRVGVIRCPMGGRAAAFGRTGFTRALWCCSGDESVC